jgi:DNA-binding NarL/FixJ family response regulator
MDPITVLLIDDHQVVRQGLRDFLEVQEGIAIVGEASSGEEGVHLARELIPDVVLMDLVMPGIDGVEATRQIKAASPNTRVIVLEGERGRPARVASSRAAPSPALPRWGRESGSSPQRGEVGRGAAAPHALT